MTATEFDWDGKYLSRRLGHVRQLQGGLLERIYGLLCAGERLNISENVKPTEAVRSQALEGITITHADVAKALYDRATEVGKVNHISAPPDVDGIADVVNDMSRHFEDELTKDTLLAWDKNLGSSIDGADREGEIDEFLDWFNHDDPTLDGVIKAGIAHFWIDDRDLFEHSGRIARAVA